MTDQPDIVLRLSSGDTVRLPGDTWTEDSVGEAMRASLVYRVSTEGGCDRRIVNFGQVAQAWSLGEPN